MISVVLSVGSNLGDQFSNICHMEDALSLLLGRILLRSDLMRTEPVGVQKQSWFLNRIISGSFDGTAEQLLDSTRKIEKSLGRNNKNQKAPRTADIDILMFGEEIIETAELTVPHSQILFRRFCLEGMNQIVPDWFIPGTAKTVSQHYEQMSPWVRAQKIFIFHE